MDELGELRRKSLAVQGANSEGTGTAAGRKRGAEYNGGL